MGQKQSALNDEKVQEMMHRLETLRARLHQALDAAGGNHLDPKVQDASSDFDAVLNAFMRTCRKRLISR